MLVGALRVFPRTVLPRYRPKSSMRQTGADSPAPSQTAHWTVYVPLWREQAVRIPSLREKQKALSPDGERAFCGRSDGIRTHGLLVPNQARYQTALYPGIVQIPICRDWDLMAARLGFEPRQTESESVVLPLHNRAMSAVSLLTTYIIILVFLEMSIGFFFFFQKSSFRSFLLFFHPACGEYFMKKL